MTAAGRYEVTRRRPEESWSEVSGTQYAISHGQQRAVITEVGATLRSYELAGEPLVLGFGLNEVPTGGRGQVLAPWPNRLNGGSFDFGGRHAQAPLDNPAGPSANHGLVRWRPWRLLAHDTERVRLGLTCYVEPAYPFCVAIELDYRLSDTGLAVQARLANRGGVIAPFGLGFHAYLHPGADTIAGCTLELPARTHLRLDAQMQRIGTESAASSDFCRLVQGQNAAPIGTLKINDCFTELSADDDGRWRARLKRGAPRPDLVVWADSAFGYAMVYSGDNMEAHLRRRGLALEPMTCPPNALQTGEAVLALGVGETVTMSWGIAPEDARPS